MTTAPITGGPLTWLVTRAADDAAMVVDALRARGRRARALPCIERTPLPWPDDLAPPRGEDGPTCVLVTSPFAAGLLAAHWPRLRARAGHAPVWCAATAPATALALEAAGLPVVLRVTGGVVELARAVAAALPPHVPLGARATVLHPTSDRAEETAENAVMRALLAPLADVVSGVVYATSPARGLARALADLPADPAPVFWSPSAVSAFVEALGAEHTLALRSVVCVGASTERAWRDRRPSPLAAVPVVALAGGSDVVAALSDASPPNPAETP